MRFIFTLFISFIYTGLVSGQIETISTKDTTRYSEKEAFDEEKFINATSLRLANKTKEAIPILQGLIKDNKTEPAYYYELARTYYLDKNYDYALTNATKAVNLAPDNLFYSIYEAEIYEKQANTEMAARKYEVIVGKYPRVEEYWLKLAKLYNDADEKEKAIGTFDRMIGVFGITEEILFRKFQTQMSMDDKVNAIKTLEELVKLSPENLQARSSLAAYYRENGREEDAKKIYKEILADDPNNANANLALAEEMKGGDQDGNYLNSIVAVVENPQITLDSKIQELVPYIRKYIETQDTSLSSPLGAIGNALIKAHPKDPKAWALTGDIRLHQGHYDEALTAYNEALNLTKVVYSIYEQKMLLLTYQKKYGELISFANEALDIYPNQLNNFINLAFAQLKLGKASEALSTLTNAELMTRSNHPQAAVINTMLAIAYMANNDKSNAENYFQKADILSKGNTNSMSQVAGMLAEFGVNLEMARLKMDAVTAKDDKDPFNAATAGMIAFKEKNYGSALKWINSSIALGGLKYPAIAELAGDVNFMSKNIARAIEYWTLAKSMGVVSPQLDKKLSSKTYVQ